MVIKFAHLHNKFGAPNTLLVPDAKVILNEDFVDYQDVIRIPAQIKFFKIYWIVEGISGEICIPGYWNYAYVNGKFYHLVKMHANRKLKMPDGTWEQFFYYNLIYDDGQNDGLNNTFYLKGTLELTGDRDLARENIHQIAPLIDNVNGFRHLNGVEVGVNDEDFKTELLIPTNANLWAADIRGGLHTFQVYDYLKLNQELKKIVESPNFSKTPNEDKLVIPLLFRMEKGGDGRGNIIRGLEKHYRNGFHVFDVSTDPDDVGTKFRRIMQQHFNTEELYTVSSKANRVYTYAKSVNPTKWIKTIDLKECTNIELLDSNTLNPRYTVVDEIPKFNTKNFVDKIIEKQQWTESANEIREKMIEITANVLIEKMGAIVSSPDYGKNKIFRNVTVEKIERDVIDTADPRGTVKNPEGMKWGDSIIQGLNHHKNFIFDNLDEQRRSVIMYTGLNLNPDTDPEGYKKLEVEYKKIINEIAVKNTRLEGMRAVEFELLPYNTLVLPVHEYKLVSEDDTDGYLDFSRNLNMRGEKPGGFIGILQSNFGIGLIPDYDRKTHVLALQNFRNIVSSNYVTLEPDPKDPFNKRRHEEYLPRRLYPFFLEELTYIEEQNYTPDGRKPSIDYLLTGYNSGKGIASVNDRARGRYNEHRRKGAQLLSRGGAFRQLNHSIRQAYSDYPVRYKHGWSACHGTSVCDMGQGTSDSDNYQYAATDIFARRSTANYVDEGAGREFQTEMSFPLKIDRPETLGGYKSVLEILNDYKDIPANFLRGEVVNSGLKHGNIKRNIRTFWDPENKNKPRVARLTDEEQKKIPRDTVVYVGICTAIDSTDENYDKYDKQQEQGIDGEGKRKVGSQQIQELLDKLIILYFNTGGSYEERAAGIYGAIPTYIIDETAENPTLYPKYLGQTNQLALCYAKPYKGFWYTAYTRFVPPKMNQILRVTPSGQTFNTKGHQNGFISIVPNPYGTSANYQPEFTFRYDINEVDWEKENTRNGQLSFMYGGIKTPDLIDIIETPKSLRTNLYNTVDNTRWGNHNGKQGGQPATDGYDAYLRYLFNGNNIILQDYIKYNRTRVTKRTDNPKEIVTQMAKGGGDRRELFVSDIEAAFPPFVTEYFNPDSNLNEVIHHWAPTGNTLATGSKLSLYKEKLEAMCNNTIQMMGNGNVGIRFTGTNGYASIKLNTTGEYPSGDYELFTNDPLVIKNKEQSTGSFVNHIENDVDVLINTRNELNIYGKTFPLKSRKSVNADLLDLGLSVTPIQDPQQSMSSIGYDVEMNFNEQDVFKTIIETPKELTKIHQFSAYEKERLIRDLQITQYEYAYDKQMLDYQRRENKFMNKYEEDMIYYNWKYGVIRGALSIASGVFEAGANLGLMGVAGLSIRPVTSFPVMLWDKGDEMWYEGEEAFHGGLIDQYRESFTKPYEERIPRVETVRRMKDGSTKMVKMRNIEGGYKQRGSMDYMENRRNAFWGLRASHGAMAGLGSIIQGAVAIGEAYDRWYVEDERRKQKYALAEDKLVSQGMILNRKHEYDRDNILRQIGQESANVQYPSLNNNIIYRHYNKLRNLKDVYITQYFPKGKLLKYIKDYYKEYGYMILVREWECTGAANIKTHLRFQFVYECNHPNVCITEMIRGRAITGIKMIPWVQ